MQCPLVTYNFHCFYQKYIIVTNDNSPEFPIYDINLKVYICKDKCGVTDQYVLNSIENGEKSTFCSVIP